MENLVFWRIMMGLLMAAGMTGAMLAIFFMKFPDSLLVAVPAAVLGGAALYFHNKKEKTARLDVYYRTAEAFGTPVAFGNLSAAFERNGSRFDVDFPQGKNSPYFKVNFRVPNLWRKFSVQSRTLLTKRHYDCHELEETPLPPDQFRVQAREPEFLVNFLKNRLVRDELSNYTPSIWTGFSILFEDGDFEMIWTPPGSEQIDGFYQACQSAVVFHDELQRISQLPR